MVLGTLVQAESQCAWISGDPPECVLCNLSIYKGKIYVYSENIAPPSAYNLEVLLGKIGAGNSG